MLLPSPLRSSPSPVAQIGQHTVASAAAPAKAACSAARTIQAWPTTEGIPLTAAAASAAAAAGAALTRLQTGGTRSARSHPQPSALAGPDRTDSLHAANHSVQAVAASAAAAAEAAQAATRDLT